MNNKAHGQVTLTLKTQCARLPTCIPKLGFVFFNGDAGFFGVFDGATGFFNLVQSLASSMQMQRPTFSSVLFEFGFDVNGIKCRGQHLPQCKSNSPMMEVC